jgi:predicted metal-dependent hydrolase
LSYVRLKHALSAIALEAIGRYPSPPHGSLVVPAMAAFARRSEDGDAVPLEVLARDVAAEPLVVRRALLDSGLFAEAPRGIALGAPYRPHAAYFRRQVTRLGEALRLVAEAHPADVPPEVHRGAALFNAGLFFEAHEYWEDVWRASGPPERTFYHGLVQAAAACYHVEKGNVHGAAVLLAKARTKLAAYAPRYLGVDVAALLASLEAVRAGTAPRGAILMIPRAPV